MSGGAPASGARAQGAGPPEPPRGRCRHVAGTGELGSGGAAVSSREGAVPATARGSLLRPDNTDTLRPPKKPHAHALGPEAPRPGADDAAMGAGGGRGRLVPPPPCSFLIGRVSPCSPTPLRWDCSPPLPFVGAPPPPPPSPTQAAAGCAYACSAAPPRSGGLNRRARLCGTLYAAGSFRTDLFRP